MALCRAGFDRFGVVVECAVGLCEGTRVAVLTESKGGVVLEKL